MTGGRRSHLQATGRVILTNLLRFALRIDCDSPPRFDPGGPWSHIASIPMNSRPLLRGAGLCLCAFFSPSGIFGQEVYLIDRKPVLLQTSPTTAVPYPGRGFFAAVEAPTNITLSPPAGTPGPITLLRRGGVFLYERHFSDQAAFDAAFPPGSYQIGDAGISTVTLNVSGAPLSVPPRLLNTTNGTWSSGGVLVVNPAQAATLTFSQFAEYTQSGPAFLEFELWGFTEQTHLIEMSMANRPLLDFAVQAAPLTSVTIPANRLVAGRMYAIQLRFGRIDTLNTTSIPNAIAASVSGADLNIFVFAQAGGAPAAPPAITSQAPSRTVAAGGSTTFTFNYTSTGGNIVHWYRDGFELNDPGRITFSSSRNSATLTSLSPEDNGNYYIHVVNSGGQVLSATATLTVTPAPEPPTPPPSIVGGWSAGDGAANGSSVLTFLKNGYYFHAEDGNPTATPGGQDGMERGTFTWNESTGAFSARTLMDTNGGWGLSNLAAGARITLTGDTLTLTAGARTTVYTRVASTTSALVGSWLFDNPSAVSGAVVFTFLPNGFYFMSDNSDPLGDPNGRKGMERGTYTWDSTTSAFTARTLTDTNGQWGLSHPDRGIPGESRFTLRIEGDIFIFPDPEAPFTLSRVGTPSAPDSRLANLSLRTQVGGPAGMLTVGFVVSGGTSNKPVLIRGIGPALSQFGVTGFLADPALTLFRGATSVGANDNWNGDAQITAISTQVGAFGIPSGTSRDAAIYSTGLAAANYSVQLNGVGPVSGDALVEIYDATPAASLNASSPRLANVSAMTRVGGATGSVLAGFVISGSGPKTVLLRAVGPTLSSFGVSDVISDPQLRLHGSIFADANDNWGGGAALRDAFVSVGAFALPANSRDAAVVATLRPGAYTIEVSGVGTASGTALIEVYEVP